MSVLTCDFRGERESCGTFADYWVEESHRLHQRKVSTCRACLAYAVDVLTPDEGDRVAVWLA